MAVFDGELSNVPKGIGVITAEDLNPLLAESPDMKLIDLRKLEELEENGIIDSGEVEQSHITLEEFIAGKGEWPEDLASQDVVQCGSGHRSTMAVSMLWSYLNEDASSLRGGFGGWAEAGLPVGEYEAAQQII